MRRTVILRGPEQRARARQWVQDAPDGYAITFAPMTRTLDQNAKLWPMLEDVARQVCWHGAYLGTDDWKNMFTASLRKSRVVPGIDGGFVVTGLSTSNMSKSEFSELIELIYAFGAERGVEWSEPGNHPNDLGKAA